MLVNDDTIIAGLLVKSTIDRGSSLAGLTISFRGLDADAGHLEAFSGIESAAGIARALTLIAHYAATGEVRRRYPFDPNVQFFLEGTEEGSFNWKIALVTVGGPLALGLTTNAIYDLTKLTLSHAIGTEPEAISSEVQQLERDRSGDLNALVEAVEPALKKGHYGVGETASEIVITETTTRSVIVTFDRNSKDYLERDVHAAEDGQDVSISALNVNDRTGRAFFLDLGRTIPFRVSKDAHPETLTTLSAAINRYANRNPAPIRIEFERIEAIDGRLKRIVIYKATDISEEE